MPDINQTLRTYARDCGVRLDIVEKDYAISYLLRAIAETPGLGERVVLKGGTALKKHEPILLPVENRPILHDFDEEFSGSLDGIF